MKPDLVTELIRINQESLDRQARIIEILIQMEKNVQYALESRRPPPPTGKLILVKN